MEFRLNAHGESKLSTLTCFSTERGQQVASVIIMGKKEAVLIDCQWTLANAFRVMAEIFETGLDLKAIYTTHAHPDHYFGIGHMAEFFPNAKLYALPEVCRVINRQFFDKMDYWEPKIGRNNVCTKTAQLTPLTENFIELEGEKIEIIPHVMGDLKYNSMVYIPSIKTLYGSDVLFNQSHMFTCEITAEQRQEWIRDLDKISQMDVEIFIPGHQRPGMPFDNSCIKYTKDYLIATDEVLATTNSAAEFYYEMAMRFPDANYHSSNEMNANVYKGGRVWDWNDEDID